MSKISKNEVVVQLTLKTLENFKYDTEEYGGNTLSEHAAINAEIVATIFNGIYDRILKDQV
ncbi:hypothetical protein [Paenibacillus apis]|uniref:hypothetical protein n=1 Tax=Paenibacillus apis TaxID=1792174 RepID=UPI00265826B6|nr:hypothetical protein [Paenibacillus apis]